MLWSEVWVNIWSSFFSIFRPMLKWILRFVTGKCELLRITYEENSGSKRTKRIEKSLKQSKEPYLKSLVSSNDYNVDEATNKVLHLKDIVVEVHSQFTRCFNQCLHHISAYRKLIDEIEALRTVHYSSDNPQHEEKLLKLWKSLKPDTVLERRISKQWGDIGFQGEDPKTDFRGMGMLGLDQLLYFGEKHPKESQHILSQSNHPQYGYSYAIVGINLTSMIYNQLKTRKLRTHFYNKPHPATLQEYHELYCYLFQEFNTFWFNEKPKDIMEFGRLRDKFNKKILNRLKDPQTTLQYNNHGSS